MWLNVLVWQHHKIEKKKTLILAFFKILKLVMYSQNDKNQKFFEIFNG